MIDIDLHLHTHYSDGSESPEDLVARARKEGLRTIAVTDHDGIDGVPAAVKAGDALGLRVVPGLEFSAEWVLESSGANGEIHTLHILGYGIDLKNDLLDQKMQKIRNSRADRNLRLRHAFLEKGISVGQDVLESYSPGGFVGKRSFAETFVKMGLASSLEEAFASERLMGDPLIRSYAKSRPLRKSDPDHSCGGGESFSCPSFSVVLSLAGQGSRRFFRSPCPCRSRAWRSWSGRGGMLLSHP